MSVWLSFASIIITDNSMRRYSSTARESTMSIANTTSAGVRKDDLESISHYMYMTTYPIIFLLGLVGNLLSSLLFTITKLNRTSCGIYFLLLSIFDSLALIGGLHHCLTIGFRISVPNATYCRARNFLSYVSMDMVSWMIVAISVDRFLKVKFPIKARIYATRKLTMIISLIILVVFVIKNVHLASAFIGDFTEDAADNCDPNPDYPLYVVFFEKVWPWIDLITFAVLPLIIVTTCNGFIIREQYKRRVVLRNRHLDRTLITLLLVSSISLFVCNLPITVLAVIYPYISLSYDNNIYDEVAFAYDLLRLPAYASMALNFYFYYYSSAIFRQQAAVLFRRFCRMEGKSNDVELIDRTSTERGSFGYRPYSIDEPDEYQDIQTSSSKRDGSFILNHYRQK